MARPRLPIGAHGTISVTQQADGSYVAKTRVRDYDGTTRPVKRTGATASQAKTRLQQHLTERARVGGSGRITPETRLSEVAKAYRGELRDSGKSAGTVDRYLSALDLHVLPGLGERAVREITPGDVGRWQRAMTPGVAKTARVVLTALLEMALADNAVTSNAVRLAPRPGTNSKSKAKAKPRALAAGEMGACLGAVTRWETETVTNIKHIPLRDVMTMQIATGGRIGEVLALRPCDVDLEARRVSINGAVKEDDEGRLVRGTVKNDAPARVVPLPQMAVDLLKRRMEDLGLDADSEQPLFPSRNGTWTWPSNVHRAWREARAMAKVDLSHVKLHLLRKTVGTVIAETGDVFLASKVLGHSSTAITEAHYVDRSRILGDGVATVLDLLLTDWQETTEEPESGPGPS